MRQREDEDRASPITAPILGQLQRRWPLARMETSARVLKIMPGEICVVCHASRMHGLRQQVNSRQASGLTSEPRCSVRQYHH